MTDQLDLLDFAHTHHHRSDPETSHAAAKQAAHFVGEHQLIVLEVLRFGDHTGDEIAARCKLDKFQVMRRTKELVERGLIEDSGERRATPKGRPSVVWRMA